MKQAFVSILACPVCKSDLVQQGRPPSDQGVEAPVLSNADRESGTLICAQRHSFPIVRGVPRFVSSDGYAANFGFEWNIHNRTQLDTQLSRQSEKEFTEKTGFTSEDLRGRLVLDVGCGMGRYSDVVSRWGARVVGIDLTSAVDAAHGNLKDRENVSLAQADVFNLPFREETFDVIFSIGVLHHTPNTRAAFDQLPRLLKPGGQIAIWVYSPPKRAPFLASDVYRRLTTRLPKRILYGLCHVAIPWYHVTRVPGLGRVAWAMLPISEHPDPEWRVLDTFDWYSPTYQWKHTEPELREWFESHGLVSLTPLGFPTSMRGVRPDQIALSRQATRAESVGA